jgi:phage tail P2-like protein
MSSLVEQSNAKTATANALPERTVLPSSASPLEIAVDLLGERRVRKIPLDAIWQTWDPDKCPAHLLPWLAYAMSIEEWDADWTEEQQRAVLRSAVEEHRTRGVVAAIRRAFANVGFPDIEIIEGRGGIRYDGVRTHDGYHIYSGWHLPWWNVYRVVVPVLMNASQAAAARRMLSWLAPARCVLWDIKMGSTLLYNNVGRYDGQYAHGAY